VAHFLCHPRETGSCWKGAQTLFSQAGPLVGSALPFTALLAAHSPGIRLPVTVTAPCVSRRFASSSGATPTVAVLKGKSKGRARFEPTVLCRFEAPGPRPVCSAPVTPMTAPDSPRHPVQAISLPFKFSKASKSRMLFMTRPRGTYKPARTRPDCQAITGPHQPTNVNIAPGAFIGNLLAGCSFHTLGQMHTARCNGFDCGLARRHSEGANRPCSKFRSSTALRRCRASEPWITQATVEMKSLP
jgi:hypothetical protein